jgi:DNA recombination protein RmuC
MNEIILWLVLTVTVTTAVLAVVVLFRLANGLGDIGKGVRDELREGREETRSAGKELREEVSNGLKSTYRMLESMGKDQQEKLDAMTERLKEITGSNREALDRIRTTFDDRVKELQESNEKKLDEMRKTVDEKLHDTLEKRLGESFKLVSDRLEAVHKGLGEMQNLAAGVGDLKRVLTNVKARGTWGEVQLGAILEQVLTQVYHQPDKKLIKKSKLWMKALLTY